MHYFYAFLYSKSLKFSLGIPVRLIIVTKYFVIDFVTEFICVVDKLL